MQYQKFSLITILLVILSVKLSAEVSPYYFLRYNQSARAAALAGCNVSLPDDASSVFFNPATIATVEEKRFSATFLKHVLDINSGNVSYIKNFDNIGTLAASVVYTNYGSFDKADRYGKKDGTFGANDLAVSASIARELDSNLYYGFTGKLIYSNLSEYNSFAFALDAGLIYQIPSKRVNIGLSILNVGAQLSKFDNVSETIPLDIRLGINHRLQGLPLTVFFSFHHLADEADNFFDKFASFSLAGELYIGKYLQARLGYDNQIRRNTSPDNEKKYSGLSGGVGLKLNKFNLDYGIAQVGLSAALHRFSINLDI